MIAPLSYLEGLKAVNTAYVPLSYPRGYARALQFEYPGADLTDCTFTARSNRHPDSDAPDFELLSVTLIGPATDSTWADYIALYPDNPLVVLPEGAALTDAIKVNTFNVTYTPSTADPDPVGLSLIQQGGNVILYWELIVAGGTFSLAPSPFCAGPLHLTAKV